MEILDITDGTARFACGGAISQTKPPTLQYGASDQNDRYECSSKKTEVVCADLRYKIGFEQSSDSYDFDTPGDKQTSGLPATLLKLRTGVIESITATNVVCEDANVATDASQGTINVQPGQQSLLLASETKLYALAVICPRTASLRDPPACPPSEAQKIYSDPKPFVDMILDPTGTVMAIHEIYRP